jgi:hypothetical protein
MMAAGIQLESIKPIDIKPDGWDIKQHFSEELPASAKFVEVWSHPELEFIETFDESEINGRPDQWERSSRWIDGEVKPRWIQRRKKKPQESHLELGFLHKNYQYGRKTVLLEPLRGNIFATIPQSKTGNLQPIMQDDDGFHWETREHRLGDSVFRAKVVEKIPDPKAWCVPCKGTGIGDAGSWSRQRRRCSKCHGAGRGLIIKKRWATFISSFDNQEPGRFYFLCELPYGKIPKDFEEAIEMLKPEAVKMAELSNRHVVRQGDIFFIETPITDQYVKEHAEKIGKTKELRLLSQNHSATRVAYLPDGLQLAKGRVYHIPGEHRVQELGDRTKWYAVVKNTVPIRKTTTVRADSLRRSRWG